MTEARCGEQRVNSRGHHIAPPSPGSPAEGVEAGDTDGDGDLHLPVFPTPRGGCAWCSGDYSRVAMACAPPSGPAQWLSGLGICARGAQLAGVAGFDEACFVGGDDGLHPVAAAEFHQDVADVGLDGGFAEEQARGDFAV
jgi:hypothetical protein